MLTQITGLHHITSFASDARDNNQFFTKILGLRRVKKTVNYDNPSVYHLYFGDRLGSPGSIMTYFPIPQKPRGTRGTGEVRSLSFAIPPDSLGAWHQHLRVHNIEITATDHLFGAPRMQVCAPDGETITLIERADNRQPWTGSDLPNEMAIRGLYSAVLQVADAGPTGDLLRFMGYQEGDAEGSMQRFFIPQNSGANTLDVVENPSAPSATQGAGSVHHIAFSVRTDAAQQQVRHALSEAGHRVTGVKDRDYFKAIYFKTPAGILFEIATEGPGFDRDEDADHLGEALKLPSKHAHLRHQLDNSLAPLE
jgi:glyoxalase family protein